MTVAGRPAARFVVPVPVTPVPVSCTRIAPWPSSPVIEYTADWAPCAVGVNVTVWWMTSPGESCWPSDTGVVVLNAPTGGAAFVRVSVMLPVLAMSKVCVAVCPTATDPNATGFGVMVRCGDPVTAVPVTGTVTEPALLATTSELSALPAVDRGVPDGDRHRRARGQGGPAGGEAGGGEGRGRRGEAGDGHRRRAGVGDADAEGLVRPGRHGPERQRRRCGAAARAGCRRRAGRTARCRRRW